MSGSPKETLKPKHENIYLTPFTKGEKKRGKGREAREIEISEACVNKDFKDFTVLLVLLFDALFKTSQLVLYLLCFSFVVLYST